MTRHRVRCRRSFERRVAFRPRPPSRYRGRNSTPTVNAVYRSLKNARDGLLLASRLDAAESIPPLLTFLFALSGRVRPYNKFLAWELTNHPLADLPFLREEFLDVVHTILATGDVAAQKHLFAAVQDIATTHGLADVLEAWGDDLSLLREPSSLRSHRRTT